MWDKNDTVNAEKKLACDFGWLWNHDFFFFFLLCVCEHKPLIFCSQEMTKKVKLNNWKLSAVNLYRSWTASFCQEAADLDHRPRSYLKKKCVLNNYCFLLFFNTFFLLPWPTNLSKKHPLVTQTQPTLGPGSCPAYTVGSPVQLEASASHSPPLPTFILSVSVYPERWFTDVTTPHLQLQLPAAVDWYQHFAAADDEHEWKISIGHHFVHVKWTAAEGMWVPDMCCFLLFMILLCEISHSVSKSECRALWLLHHFSDSAILWRCTVAFWRGVWRNVCFVWVWEKKREASADSSFRISVVLGSVMPTPDRTHALSPSAHTHTQPEASTSHTLSFLSVLLIRFVARGHNFWPTETGRQSHD